MLSKLNSSLFKALLPTKNNVCQSEMLFYVSMNYISTGGNNLSGNNAKSAKNYKPTKMGNIHNINRPHYHPTAVERQKVLVNPDEKIRQALIAKEKYKKKALGMHDLRKHDQLENPVSANINQSKTHQQATKKEPEVISSMNPTDSPRLNEENNVFDPKLGTLSDAHQKEYDISVHKSKKVWKSHLNVGDHSMNPRSSSFKGNDRQFAGNDTFDQLPLRVKKNQIF